MSLLGTWRFFLAEFVSEAEIIGLDAHDAVIQTGDLRHAARDPAYHICQMFCWDDVVALARRHGAVIAGGSASNFAWLGDQMALDRLEEDPDRWHRFVEHEVSACRRVGARDGGTHILFAIQR
jgi:protein associated with RNAse G/E